MTVIWVGSLKILIPFIYYYFSVSFSGIVFPKRFRYRVLQEYSMYNGSHAKASGLYHFTVCKNWTLSSHYWVHSTIECYNVYTTKIFTPYNWINVIFILKHLLLLLIFTLTDNNPPSNVNENNNPPTAQLKTTLTMTTTTTTTTLTTASTTATTEASKSTARRPSKNNPNGRCFIIVKGKITPLVTYQDSIFIWLFPLHHCDNVIFILAIVYKNW